MRLDGALGHEQPGGDRAVRHALGHQPQDFSFPIGEPGQRVGPAPPAEQAGDDRGVDDRFPVHDPPEGVDDGGDVEYPFLEQVPDPFGMILDEPDGIARFDVLGQHQDADLRIVRPYHPGRDERVSDLSRGKISVKVVYSVGGLAPDAEQQVVKDVAAGSYDLGFAGTSVFDTLGVRSFEALSAPMLIDSYPLENAVIRSSLPARMMAGLAKLDVTGLAVLGDEMRRPVGVRQPIVSLADWRGITFGIYQSNTEDAAIRALGAKPGPGFGTARDQALASGALQGFDLNLVYYQQLNKEPAAPYITANVNLWPRTVALFANPGRRPRP